MRGRKPRVLLLRGYQATPWNLRQWEGLTDRFDVAYLATRSNMFDIGEVALERIEARALRDFLPRSQLARLVTELTGDRYMDADAEFARADIVHAEELSYWFAADAARRKNRYRYKLVLTVWETLPLLAAFRNRFARRYRRETLASADLLLAVTERARNSLLLEGVAPERIEVCPPGIDVDRFGGSASEEPGVVRHVLVSPGRLVWEKGHQDVIRALAALRRGLVACPAGVEPRLVIVGSGPERARLAAHARELGVGDAVDFRSVSYDDMPAVYRTASCLVLASAANAACSRYLGDLPRCFWEEQFGLVLAEAMAAGLPIVTTTSGAIPEVAGESAEYVAPGDWLELARKLAAGPLARAPGTRVEHPPERVRRYSTAALADRLAASYERLLS